MSAAIYMDAEIKPNRSLSERGFVVLISVITLANVASAIVFLKIGAHLVPIFLGIDVVAITIAYLVLPANPDPVTAPANLIWHFRINSLAGSGLLWLVIGSTFGWLGDRASPRATVRAAASESVSA